MDLTGSFEARRPKHGVSGWGNINWASPQMSMVYHDDGEHRLYVSYDTYNEFGRYYKPFSSSFTVYPDREIVCEHTNGEVIEHPFGDFIHDPVFTPEWGTWEHALLVYWEVFGRDLTAEEEVLIDTINHLTPDDFTKEIRGEVGRYLDDDRVIELCHKVLFKEDGSPNYYAHHVVVENCGSVKTIRKRIRDDGYEIWLTDSCNIRV
jgi:hypothetical protein